MLIRRHIGWPWLHTAKEDEQQAQPLMTGSAVFAGRCLLISPCFCDTIEPDKEEGGMPVSLHEQIVLEVMQMTDAQKAEVLEFAKALRRKDDRDITALMKSIVAENEVAFKDLAK